MASDAVKTREERDKVHDLKAERVLRELQEMAKRILRAKGYAVALVGLLTLPGGCTYYAQGKALEKAAEPYVDQAVDDIVARLCKMPIDIMERQLDTDDKALGAYLLCPPLRDLVDAVNAARDPTNGT